MWENVCKLLVLRYKTNASANSDGGKGGYQSKPLKLDPIQEEILGKEITFLQIFTINIYFLKISNQARAGRATPKSATL